MIHLYYFISLIIISLNSLSHLSTPIWMNQLTVAVCWYHNKISRQIHLVKLPVTQRFEQWLGSYWLAFACSFCVCWVQITSPSNNDQSRLSKLWLQEFMWKAKVVERIDWNPLLLVWHQFSFVCVKTDLHSYIWSQRLAEIQKAAAENRNSRLVLRLRII